MHSVSITKQQSYGFQLTWLVLHKAAQYSLQVQVENKKASLNPETCLYYYNCVTGMTCICTPGLKPGHHHQPRWPIDLDSNPGQTQMWPGLIKRVETTKRLSKYSYCIVNRLMQQ